MRRFNSKHSPSDVFSDFSLRRARELPPMNYRCTEVYPWFLWRVSSTPGFSYEKRDGTLCWSEVGPSGTRCGQIWLAVWSSDGWLHGMLLQWRWSVE